MKLPLAISLLLTLSVAGALAADTTSTNQPAAPATNEIAEAKPPGREFTNSVGMQLVHVPGDFWAGKYEVTQKQYRQVMGDNPSAFPGELHPVENVSWDDAVAFCKKLTELDLKKKFLPEGYHYTLPTEDEWESLVADASLDDAISSIDGNVRTTTSDVGTLHPNSLGLYDVRGNVMEFCMSDESKPFRFLKGGSFQDRTEINLRPEFRWYCKPDERQDVFGIRVLLKAN